MLTVKLVPVGTSHVAEEEMLCLPAINQLTNQGESAKPK